MKYLIITAFIFIFSQNVFADEAVTHGTDLNENDQALQEVSTEESYKATSIKFSEVNYYEYSDTPSYKPKSRILLGGIVPFIPIRSTIDKSVEEPELIDKRVSFMLYFKQNF